MEYIRNKYSYIYDKLLAVVKSHKINCGKVSVIPFSVCETYLQYLHLFNNESAKNLMELILSHSMINTSKKRLFTKIFG